MKMPDDAIGAQREIGLSCLLKLGVLRRFAATVFGRDSYERCKAILKRRSSIRVGRL